MQAKVTKEIVSEFRLYLSFLIEIMLQPCLTQLKIVLGAFLTEVTAVKVPNYVGKLSFGKHDSIKIRLSSNFFIAWAYHPLYHQIHGSF